jgi:hypothetical protein
MKIFSQKYSSGNKGMTVYFREILRELKRRTVFSKIFAVTGRVDCECNSGDFCYKYKCFDDSCAEVPQKKIFGKNKISEFCEIEKKTFTFQH